MAAKGTIGGKIVLEGEKQYKQALKEIKSAQVELKSEMKLCSAEFKNNEKSVEALEKKNQILSKTVEQAGKKVQVYEKLVAASSESQKKAAESVDELQKKLETEKEKLSELAKAEGNSTEQIEKQKKTIEDLGRELEQANRNYTAATDKNSQFKTSLNYANVELTNMNRELLENNKELKEANDEIDPLKKNINEYSHEVQQASEHTNVFGGVLKANLTSEAIIATVKALAGAIKEIASASISTGMEFESSMSKVEALSGAAGSELESLTEKAKEMGASTMYSASEAADAFGYMALAGWDTKQMLDGIEPVLNLAAAANMDLATASDIVTDYLTAFGLEAKDAAKFTDQLAYAMANSNTDVVQLGEAYKNCAATAASLGYSVEDVTAVLMTMANAGVKGGEAGTGLSSIMTRLATNTKECGDALAEYGVEIYNEEGKMNSLGSILEGMSSIWSGLTDQQQASLAKTIAGTNQYSKLQTIMSGLSDSAKESGMSFQDYSDALRNADGSAKEMADTMQNNLKGKLTILESSMDALKESIYETFDDSLKTGVDGATSAVSRLNNAVKSGSLNASLSKLGENLNKIAMKGIDLGEKALPVIVNGLNWMLENTDKISAGVVGLGSAFAAMKVVTSVTTMIQGFEGAVNLATIAQAALNGTMLANPIVAVTALVVGLTAAVVTYAVTTKTATEEFEESAKRLTEGYKQVAEASNGAAESANAIAMSSEAESRYINDLIDRLKDLNKQESLSQEESQEMAKIVEILNAKYEDVGLTINKQTGHLDDNTNAWEKNIKQQLKVSQVNAAMDEYNKHVEQQTQNSIALYEVQSKMNDLWDEYGNVLGEIQDSAGKMDEMNSYQFQHIDDLNRQYEEQIILNREYQSTIDELNNAYDEEQKAIDTITGFMEDQYGVMINEADAADQVASSMNSLADSSIRAEQAGDSIVKMSDDVIEAMTEMHSNVYESVKSQMNIFEEFSSKSEVTKEQLIKNLESQIEGITNWAENLQELANRGVNEGLLQTLSEMGPQGAAYVSEFVKMTDDELKDYGEKFQQAAEIPGTVSQQIMDSYSELGKSNAVAYKRAQIEQLTGATLDEMMHAGYEVGSKTDEALAKGMQESSKAKEQAVKTVDGVIDSADQVRKQKAKPTGKSIGDDVGSGIESSTKPGEASAKLAASIVTNFQSRLSEVTTLGRNISEGLAAGMLEGVDKVAQAASKIANTAYGTTKKDLDINSPSKKMKYLGLMSGEGYNAGLKESLTDTSGIINSMTNDINSLSKASLPGASINIDNSKILNILEEYLPYISQKQNVDVRVGLEPDSAGIFNIVRQESLMFKKAKGYDAM